MQGLRVYDGNGNTILDVTDRLTRVCGTVNTGTADGSITDDALLTGTPWYFLLRDGITNENYWLGAFYWEITFSENKLIWTGRGWTDQVFDQKIVYGVY